MITRLTEIVQKMTPKKTQKKITDTYKPGPKTVQSKAPQQSASPIRSHPQARSNLPKANQVIKKTIKKNKPRPAHIKLPFFLRNIGDIHDEVFDLT